MEKYGKPLNCTISGAIDICKITPLRSHSPIKLRYTTSILSLLLFQFSSRVNDALFSFETLILYFYCYYHFDKTVLVIFESICELLHETHLSCRHKMTIANYKCELVETSSIIQFSRRFDKYNARTHTLHTYILHTQLCIYVFW